MNDFALGDVAICGSGQAGTIIQVDSNDLWILLRNGDIWTGRAHECRHPQSQEDLDAAPINVNRLESKRLLRPEHQAD
jgi:hypothetical protein